MISDRFALFDTGRPNRPSLRVRPALWITGVMAALTMLAGGPATAWEPTETVFEEDFENGTDRWEILDPGTWKLSETDGNRALEITARKSEYEPPHRSPLHVALVKDLELADFEITFRVRSTLDTGNHRDCCVFFNYQDDKHFYYVHLGAKPDPHSGQIMIVNDADRLALTENEKTVPWDDGWHTVKLVRDTTKGSIDVYFDDMQSPHLSVVDKTFGKGRIGIGSFDDLNEFDQIVIRK
ncbi:hypothetical protein Pan14r_19140 [Crateriforma conspicua]|uniref:3-keto-disaccharide hydrolase domain-containing protein n=2 Tax=Crateriforma conspicua TaxID=2527996 RepID=A0A5C5Y5X3_9PLAN|nr:hypothetical protein [Crateriforma conspicua]TWT69625.1 hypothetical protein Pan14r_19140 [Crateriforma conspicua]